MNSLRQKIDLLFSPKYLLYTNFALGGTFLAAGDVIEQQLNKKVVSKFIRNKESEEQLKEKLKDKNADAIDLDRVAAMAKSGLIIGLCGHYWYKFLDTRFPGKARATIIKKLGCEMAIGPPWILITFLTVGFFEKQPLAESFQKFKENLLTVLAADWCFYVPLQSLNFKFIPPRFRFAYVCCLTVIYDIFLAFILHK